jgi:hypothetical protein
MIEAPFPPQIRARTLRALLALTDAMHGMDVDERWRMAIPSLMPCEIAAAELASNDDLALANACLELEHELRQKEFAGVESLLAVLTPCGDADRSLDDRLRDLPSRLFAQAASGLYRAGWVYD